MTLSQFKEVLTWNDFGVDHALIKLRAKPLITYQIHVNRMDHSGRWGPGDHRKYLCGFDGGSPWITTVLTPLL